MSGDVLALYEKYCDKMIKGSNNQWVAICPFHDDRKHSFSINAETGQYNCKASSCGKRGNAVSFAKEFNEDYKPFLSNGYLKNRSTTGISVKNGLKTEGMSDKTNTNKHKVDFQKLKEMNKRFVSYLPEKYAHGIYLVNEVGMDFDCFTFPYFNEDGKIDGIKRHKPKGNCWGNMGARWYGIWHIEHQPKDKPLYIVEGEKDVCTMKNAEFGAVISVSGGTNSFPPIPKVFKEFKEINILYDNDDSGRIGERKLADKIYSSLGVLPYIGKWRDGLPDKFDVSDENGLTEFQFAMQNKKEHQLSIKQDITSITKKGFQPMSFNAFTNTDWKIEQPLVQYLIGENQLSTIGGCSGIGKSWMALNLALSIASGKKFMDFFETKKRKVLLCQFELTNGQLKKRLGILKPHYFQNYTDLETNLTILPKTDSFNDQWTPLYELLESGGYKDGVVIVDNLYTSVGVDVDTSKNLDLIPVVQKIDEIMMKFSVAVVLITHHKKGTMETIIDMDNILGGATLTRFSANVFQVKNSLLDNDLRVGKLTKTRDEACELNQKAFKIKFDEGYFTKGQVISKEILHYQEPSDRWEMKLINEMNDYTGFTNQKEWNRDYLWVFLQDKGWDKNDTNERKVTRFLNKVIDYGLVQKLGHNQYRIIEDDTYEG
jgi:RecA-family ATPase/5S rRNA maturation endonuclease (ribonuclease M5)|tara:strand:+ start:2158 stop:4125 length:1968 start_codon:yes stop_codon:yes gene_type:complete